VKNAPAFVFDWMEPERPKVDGAEVGLPQIGGVASGGFHDQRDDGVVRLNAELARRMADVVARPTSRPES
jgi:hypothetical protein